MAEKKIDTIVENMARILPILARIFMKGVRAKTSYPPQVIFVMGALTHHGKLTMTGIGNHLSVPKPQVTTLIDRLFAEELVERLNDDKDRRIIYIQLTPKGKDRFQEIKSMMFESMKTALTDLDNETLEKLQLSSITVCEAMIELNAKFQNSCCQLNNSKTNQ
ncbi:MAG: transcriptional regulator, MarR family [Bacteroidetes bacterium]|jgi:DNA-binding MarR family transcriptional regulator|nr:transcriptional regulator, MarR family [Bacteroidota bacterium]